MIAMHDRQTELQFGITGPGDHYAIHGPPAKLHCILHAVGDNGLAQAVKVQPLLF